MARYFIEVAYNGKAYAGFQRQNNANTIQAEVERALQIYFKSIFELTGSSRTDAGVHAKQNYFHFDSPIKDSLLVKSIYHLNAILPLDIVVKNICKVRDNAHCRFDAVYRQYRYLVYTSKDPFMQETGYYYPYSYNPNALVECANEFMRHSNFQAFSKRNAQVSHFNCILYSSECKFQGNYLSYTVRGNRFLRGMVKALVGTMLNLASNSGSKEDLINILQSGDCTKANFSVPSKGLTLEEVNFRDADISLNEV